MLKVTILRSGSVDEMKNLIESQPITKLRSSNVFMEGDNCVAFLIHEVKEERDNPISDDAKELLSYYNSKGGTQAKAIPSNLDKIQARLENYNKDELRDVVDMQYKNCRDNDKMIYYSIQTIFRSDSSIERIRQMHGGSRRRQAEVW